MRGISIAGRKRNDGIDYYQTPEWATIELLKRESFKGTILEPCCGAGAISKVLEFEDWWNNNPFIDEQLKNEKIKREIISSDIRTDNDVYRNPGKDVFTYEANSFDNIITNPPYIYAQEVIEHCLKIAKHKVAMILKLCFLESKGRYLFFKNNPLKKIYVFCKRVQMYPEGIDKPKNGGTIAYAWYVWDKLYTGNPQIEWIET